MRYPTQVKKKVLDLRDSLIGVIGLLEVMGLSTNSTATMKNNAIVS